MIVVLAFMLFAWLNLWFNHSSDAAVATSVVVFVLCLVLRERE